MVQDWGLGGRYPPDALRDPGSFSVFMDSTAQDSKAHPEQAAWPRLLCVPCKPPQGTLGLRRSRDETASNVHGRIPSLKQSIH